MKFLNLSTFLSLIAISSLASASVTLTCTDLGLSKTTFVLQLDIPASIDPGSPYASSIGTGSVAVSEFSHKVDLNGFQNRSVEVVGVRGEENITQYTISGSAGDLVLKFKPLGTFTSGFGRLTLPAGLLQNTSDTEFSVGCSAE